MGKGLLKRLEKLNKNRRQRKWWQRLVHTMAMIVVFCTTYALILPAITMEQEPICGLEDHVHTESCYTQQSVLSLACDVDSQTNVLHTHAALCYDAQNQLVCSLAELEEHSHEDACYGQVLTCTAEHICGEDCITTEQVLVCTVEDSEHIHAEACYESREIPCALVHTHAESCYTQGDLPICGKEEILLHNHEESCYALDGTLTCTRSVAQEHSHEDACYGQVLTCTAEHICGEDCITTEQVLVCTVEDSEHIHAEACYESREIPCALVHTHAESCYTQGDLPICGKEEILLHNHEESCYALDGTLTCTRSIVQEHIHSESCLTASEETSQVLVCGMEEHTHEDSCYPLEDEENTQSDYLCGTGVHAHVETCYDETGKRTCTISEHSHEAACLVEGLDLTADVESLYDWEEALSELCLTGNWSEDVLAVAKSQLDYQESVKNVILADGRLKGYTRYGAWYGDAYGDWDAMFAAFCLYYAGVKNYPLESEADLWIEALTEQGLYFTSDVYSAKPGDLIFFDYDQVEDSAVEIPIEAERVGIVVELIPAVETEPARIQTIEGDTAGQVAYVTYDVDDVTIIGYAALPEQTFYCGIEPHYHEAACADESGSSVCGQDSHVHDETCWDMDQSFAVNGRTLECGEDHAHTADCYGDAVARFSYEDDIVSMKITVVSSTGIPRGTQLEVTDLSDESFESYFAYADENSVGELTGLVGYEFHFYLAGEEIEIEDAQITVEMAVNGSLNNFETDVVLFSTEPEEEDGAEAEEEPASTVTILSENGGAVTIEESMEYTGSPQSFTFTTGGRSVALMSESAATFTVEYYAHFPLFQTSKIKPTSGTYLEIIDTSGGKLPSNTGSTDNPGANGILYLMLKDTGENKTVATTSGSATRDVYEVDSVDTLTKVYKDAEKTYAAGMNIKNLDTLHENDHYELAELWVYHKDAGAWTVYTEDEEIINSGGYVVDRIVPETEIHDLKFTNNPSGATDTTILIEQDAIVRMVYTLETATQYVSANMFDYDISDTNVYVRNSSGTILATYTNANDAIWYVNNNSRDDGMIYMSTVDASGNNQGINSPRSYVVGSGSAHLAFGNSNTGVTYSSDQLNGAYINQANRANSSSIGGFKYCSFGLVESYDPLTDTLTYASGISAQALFNDEAYYARNSGYSATGKTTYSSQRLDFTRTGDTYVLTAINGGSDALLGNGVYASGLDKFNYTFNTSRSDLLSNNFWPMDGTSGNLISGKDMKFGAASEYSSNFRKYVNRKTNGNGTLPLSDDGYSHNSYFGMQFSVEFSLDGEYCGPLEYLFYGDDDMWVFLTDITQQQALAEAGKNVSGATQLICDIGGVHSSVGSFTNLWDYIPSDSTNTYRLTFFYTERGASGSSCYMEFTLPQVISVPQNTNEVGSISVSKDVEGVETEESYEFEFLLSGSVDGLTDNFLYKIDNANGASASSGTIASGGTFSLTDGQTITILGIPKGATYTITEKLTDEQTGYEVTWSDGTDGNSITGTVKGNTTHSYTCVNEALGSLEVTKYVSGTSTTDKFKIDVTLTDAGGNPLSGTFGGYTFNGDGKLTLELGSGEKAILTGIPAGTAFTVMEQLPDGYHVQYKLNDETVIAADGTAADSAAGVISHKTTVSVSVLNATSYRLPETGGNGTFLFTFGGLLMIAAACVYFVIQNGRKYRRGGMYRKS